MNTLINTYHAINHLFSLLHDEQRPLTPYDRAKLLADFAVRANAQLFEIMGVTDEMDFRKSSNHIAEVQDSEDREADVIYILDLGECHPRLELQDEKGRFPWGTVVHLCHEEVRCYRPNAHHQHPIILDYDAAVSYIVTHLALQINLVIPWVEDELTKARLAEILNHYARPPFQVKHCVGHGAFWYKDKAWPYAILSPKLEPRLPGFLGFSEDEFLFVSADVPEAYREHQLRHELIEHLQYPEAPNRCLLALKEELQSIGPDMRKAYLGYRRDFFDRLIAFYEVNPHPDLDFMRRITQSRDYLNTQLPTHGG